MSRWWPGRRMRLKISADLLLWWTNFVEECTDSWRSSSSCRRYGNRLYQTILIVLISDSCPHLRRLLISVRFFPRYRMFRTDIVIASVLRDTNVPTTRIM